MCFPDTKKGKREKKTASKVYAGNRNLLLVAREEKSYLDMRDTFSKTRVILTPDIVMSIDCSDEIKSGTEYSFVSDQIGKKTFQKTRYIPLREYATL